jgi:hypothetical protein
MDDTHPSPPCIRCADNTGVVFRTTLAGDRLELVIRCQSCGRTWTEDRPNPWLKPVLTIPM